jgi:UDP-2-acetamido-3-amino-2,3-dideoxy-glucuronate N-acetyltransferase
MSQSNTAIPPSAKEVIITPSKVRGVVSYELPFIEDARGNLTVGEFGRPLPFIPERYFITFAIPSGTQRGEHAHRECAQYLTCVHGSCSVLVDDGVHQQEFLLDRPTLGLYVPPMIWATECKHSADSTLIVFASHHYDPSDYIRDYLEFQRLAIGRQ